MPPAPNDLRYEFGKTTMVLGSAIGLFPHMAFTEPEKILNDSSCFDKPMRWVQLTLEGIFSNRWAGHGILTGSSGTGNTRYNRLAAETFDDCAFVEFYKSHDDEKSFSRDHTLT